MPFEHGRKRVLVTIIAIGCAALLVWYFWGGHRSNKETEEGAEAPSRVSVEQGQRILTFDQATQAKGGILTSPVKAVTYHKEIKAYGTVLDFQPMADLRKVLLDSQKNLADVRNNFGIARAQVEKAKVSLDASQKEYERLRILHEDNRNVSDKALQAGEVAWRSDEATARSAQEAFHSAEEVLHTGEQSLEVLKDSARQQWGNIISSWLIEGGPPFERLRQRMDVLIQITLPSDERIASLPRSVRIETGPGTVIAARLVSPSPKTDPKIQGMSFFYLAPSQRGLLQGMDIRAYLPIGQIVQGLFIPASAAVWWQGKTWVYAQEDTTRFVRREISTDVPVQGGWFIPKGSLAEDRVVTQGAELMLSEEFRSQIEKEEE